MTARLSARALLALTAVGTPWLAHAETYGTVDISAQGTAASNPFLRTGGDTDAVGAGVQIDPSLVFDEVDAGIGGRVADVVGARLGDLGERFQVLCITHLPQIAARASTHFRIDKTVRRDRTVTSVQRLDAAGRIDEIGRMIGGASVTDLVRASAEELLNARGRRGSAPDAKGKHKAKGESETRRRI